MMKSNVICLLLFGVVLLASGCSSAPTRLMNLDQRAQQGKINAMVSAQSEARVISKDDQLTVQIILSGNDVCEGTFHLTAEIKGAHPQLAYKGSWKAGMSQQCNTFLENPGDEERFVAVSDRTFTGERWLTTYLCSKPSRSCNFKEYYFQEK
jgi:hypothetical protein